MPLSFRPSCNVAIRYTSEHAWSTFKTLCHRLYGDKPRLMYSQPDIITRAMTNKVRINDLARELGTKSRDMLSLMAETGIGAGKTHSSSITQDEATMVRSRVREQQALSSARGRPSVLARTLTDRRPTPLDAARMPVLKPQQPKLVAAHFSDQPASAFRESLIARGLITPNVQRPSAKLVVPTNHQTARVTHIPSSSMQAAVLKTRLARATVHSAGPSVTRSSSRQAKHSNTATRESYQQEQTALAARERALWLKQNLGGPLQILQQRANVQARNKERALWLTQNLIKPLQIMRQKPIAQANSKPVVTCTLCRARVYEDAIERHMTNCHPAKQEPSLPIVSGSHFPFVLLPPGHWEFRAVFEHYRKKSSSLAIEQDLDWQRIEEIKSLKPILRHVGVKAWLGYAVYEFTFSDRIVLETPIRGNATYVLSGDWQKRIYLSKAELRLEYANKYTKIVHKGRWIQRVRAAL